MLDGSSTIRGPHLIAALALWEYAEASARFIFGESLGDADGEKLLAALKGSPEGLTRTEISREVFGGNKTSARMTDLLTRMLGQGLIHKEARHQGKRGPQAEVWRSGQNFRVVV